MSAVFATLKSGQALPRRALPELPLPAFRRAVRDAIAAGHRVASFFADEERGLHVVLAADREGHLLAARTRLAEGETSFPSLTPECAQVHLFEREIFEQRGLLPEGHPFLKPVRFPPAAAVSTVGVADFFQIKGHDIHEVAVGPVHAGVIEPGHFRFQCHGETVFHLEISLGYQHRGIERRLRGGPDRATLAQMETAAGDSSIGHGWAYCRLLESLAGVEAPPRAQLLRAAALELERLANHTGDLGALAGDVGFLPTQSFCGRLRGDFLNLSAELCGSRFGRGLLVPGGVRFDLDRDGDRGAARRLDEARRDVTGAVELLFDTPSVLARFEGTGPVSAQTAREIGLVGPAARACGLELDVRRDHPFGPYGNLPVPPATVDGGDVQARALVRWLEIQRSLDFLLACLRELDSRPGPIRGEVAGLAPEHFCASLVEGWRGEICHVALTDAAGRFGCYKITDPSFHNWFGLALALRGQQISDFPLCNKSFNLSYCGFDL